MQRIMYSEDGPRARALISQGARSRRILSMRRARFHWAAAESYRSFSTLLTNVMPITRLPFIKPGSTQIVSPCLLEAATERAMETGLARPFSLVLKTHGIGPGMARRTRRPRRDRCSRFLAQLLNCSRFTVRLTQLNKGNKGSRHAGGGPDR
jgi:hypothetical protein